MTRTKVQMKVLENIKIKQIYFYTLYIYNCRKEWHFCYVKTSSKHRNPWRNVCESKAYHLPDIIMTWFIIWGLLCQGRVWRAGTSNYTPGCCGVQSIVSAHHICFWHTNPNRHMVQYFVIPHLCIYSKSLIIHRKGSAISGSSISALTSAGSALSTVSIEIG